MYTVHRCIIREPYLPINVSLFNSLNVFHNRRKLRPVLCITSAVCTCREQNLVKYASIISDLPLSNAFFSFRKQTLIKIFKAAVVASDM